MKTIAHKVATNFTRGFAYQAFGCGLLALLGIIHLVWHPLYHRIHRFERADLIAARDYAAALSPSAAPTLFSSNWRRFRVYGAISVGRDGLEKFRRAQAIRFLTGISGGNITILVAPGLVDADAAVRQQMLRGYLLDARTAAQMLKLARNSTGCSAAKRSNFGWTDAGYLLVDPMVTSMDREGTMECISDGLGFLNGIPSAGGVFVQSKMPPRGASAAILTAVMNCAYEGRTDREPALRSNDGITSRPSIACIREKIAAKLR